MHRVFGACYDADFVFDVFIALVDNADHHIALAEAGILASVAIGIFIWMSQRRPTFEERCLTAN
jgi:hypothetical protein